MLEQVLRELKNYFITEVWVGNFSIENKNLADIDFLKQNQYYRISGSLFNDGVHKYPSNDLTDEEFEGEIWAMAIPPSVIALSDEIKTWSDQYGSAIDSPYQSESFGGYSYSKMSSSSASAYSWKNAFASRLNEWRKIRYESPIRSNDYVRHT
jgi:hypothetical protein